MPAAYELWGKTIKAYTLQQAAYLGMMPERFNELLGSDVIALLYDVQEPLAHYKSQ